MHLGIIKITYNRTAQPRCSNLCNAFYGQQFREPRRGDNSLLYLFDFAMTIWRFWISDCKYVLLLVWVFAIDCSNAEFCTSCVCVCVCVRVRARVWRERQGHITVESAVLTAACVLQIYTCIITVSVTRLCSSLVLELMVKLRTLLTVFIFTLKAELARDHCKGRYISDACLRCSANHNALGQLANKSRLHLLEGGAL